MTQVMLKIIPVGPGEVGQIIQDQEILGVLGFRRHGEIKGAGNYHPVVDNHDFIVGDGVLIVDEHGDFHVFQEGGGGIFLGPVGFVQNRNDLDASLSRLNQGPGDGLAGEGVSLDKDFGFGLVNLAEDGVGAAAVGGKVDPDGAGLGQGPG